MKIGSIFNRHGVAFHLTGGVVASYYGEQRNTQDVDIVAQMASCRNPDALFDDLRKLFLLDKGTYNEAIRNKSMFQILDIDTLARADIYAATDVPKSFERAVPVKIAENFVLPVAAPEDSILSKLIWIKRGSGRSKKDVVGILRVQENLDNDYLYTTAESLGVKEILEELKVIADSYDPTIVL
ncbi:MAG: hypothetical protein LBN39_02065 [Planctomycetaceae bacterium]|nr:hypothetical protein [Planctomycetaceae bacterium]